MAQKPIEDIKLVVRALFDGSYPERGMGDRKIIAGGELCVVPPRIKNMIKITPQKFYNLFLEEVEKSGIQSVSWDNNKEWTNRMLKNKNCVMETVAKSLSFLYCHDYYYLDGVFYRKKLGYKNFDIELRFFAQNIEVIIEHENNYRGIETEIHKLIPLFIAPLKVIITYVESDRDIQKIKKIENIIRERIKNDDLFSLHKNKIETLLIVGFLKNNEIHWRSSVYKNGEFELLDLK